MNNKLFSEYPVNTPQDIAGSGNQFYLFLLNNLKIPASATHNIWYNGELSKLNNPLNYSFRGNIPKGKTLELLTLNGAELFENDFSIKTEKNTFSYQFQGNESPVLVKDLSDLAKEELNIPLFSKGTEKVFNPNFKNYDELDEMTRVSNELACLSVPKSISSYFGGKNNSCYSEKDILNFLGSSIKNINGKEMMHILHGNHLAWVSLAYIREKGNVQGNIQTEFYSQNSFDFYAKDLGTVLPMIFFAFANLGKDPVKIYQKFPIEIWGALDAATYMQQFMKK